ncbi:RING finger protein 10 [Diorhabda carinulata]|uniref:RING finger protein 10 n=1 Tax=Diorhabda carinulata TaxID=1163345 RepID=UPI0025A1EFE4|nr:RING finger protein 10 [Diorhabda carinulata]
MEKKGNRNLSLARGSTTDSKKDGVSTKPWPRGSRRREVTGASLTPKLEVSRKPQTQRVKTIDKRPRSRGTGYYSGATTRNETTGLEEDNNIHHVELGSVFSPGSKKQSHNNLINFSYPPRGSFNYPAGRRGNGNRRMGTIKHKYNKEQFLQANCQFIVNSNGDYKKYLDNPDALVDWNLIEQVNLQVSEYSICPICLYPPMAAKITRCGHIYCWSCVLHYLSLSDNPSRKCPICFDTIYKQDLRSVVVIPFTTLNNADTITFRLMKRPKDCLIAYPADAEIKDVNYMFNFSENGSKDVYSKLLLATVDDILAIIDREKRELKNQFEEEDGPEKGFIEQAMALLKEREDSVCENVEYVKDHHGACAKVNLEAIFHDLEISDNIKHFDKTIDNNLESCSQNQPVKIHYFYQAFDGQHIYLNSINANMLEHSYNSLELCPKILTGKIVEKVCHSMTEDLRKRMRYLQHLPLTCQFEIAEIELKTPIVTKETLEKFHDKIESRKQMRRKRAKEEKRREKRIEIEENRKMKKYAHPNLHLESNIQFPEFGFEARLRTESESTLPSEQNTSSDLGGPTPSFSVESSYAGPSFAKMLATEKKPSVPSWSDLKSTSSTSNSPKLINVTGSKMKMLSNVRRPSLSEEDPDDYEPVPSFNRSFGDAIAQALELKEKGDIEYSRQPGKKKKKTKQVLFATGMAYSEK